MNASEIRIRFDGDTNRFPPGDTLSGEYELPVVEAGAIKAVEASVLWYSEGKGDEDLAVHEFWRLDAEDGDFIDPARVQRFHTTLPPSPLSYEGVILKICWCVRVRVFLHGGKDLVAEKPFRLGEVFPAKVATS